MGGLYSPKKSSPGLLTLGLIFVAFICLYVLFFIRPDYVSLTQTRQTLSDQTAELERLKLIYPVFARSKALDQIQFEPRLPFPPRVSIHRKDLAKLSEKISRTAQKNQLSLVGYHLDVNSLKETSQSIPITLKLQGDLWDFRNFLIEMISFSFFDSFESFNIQPHEATMKNFTLTLNVLTKTNPS